ncbi:SDR family NAD(P)-dependent oxidoreductase [Mumia sp. zg.B53]|uniref:SDR family NAD(P)-dependent oxidoreductase n=1 Tax=Mumia sp. zg.B53 TaxID=2855449 RepID=UPI001C6E526D|nr:SDR family NAD(P)-dependent oxidoreductase [Mumia sp. zg.B53]MBW9216108.1 SDR family NAD(P)-dependent oxidoreductase [Mumia sp. zg.B53]
MSTPTAPSRPLSVVTGASSGIGRALVDEFVGAGFDLIAVSDEDMTDDIARSGLGEHVRPLTADLATPSGNDDVVAALVADRRPVSAAVLNAGVGVHGRFDRADLADHLRVVGVNVVSPVRLAHHLLSGMVARGEGRLMVTSSIAADGPGPFQSTYAASKAFLTSFAQALRYEMRGAGVTVTSLEPGPTDTRFFARARMEETWLARGPKADPATVAREGFAAMMAGKRRVVSGSKILKVQSIVTRRLPGAVSARFQAPLARPRGDR